MLMLPLLAMIILPKVQSQTQTQTAGQKFKNIKVLTEMPADQLGKVMNIISASLGVNCAFCHVVDQWDKDDKKPKNDARAMMKMTFEINKGHFNNRPEVTCNTCHSGHERPVGAPNLNPMAVEERPTQPEKKPTIDEILAKYETAMGGKAKLDKVTSRQIKASRIEPDGKTAEIEQVLQKPGKLTVATTYPNAVVSEGFDGTNAWKKTDKGEIQLNPDEAENIKREAQIFANVNLKVIYPTMDVRFLDKINGKEVWLVLATTADKRRERLYFDPVTGLLVRRAASSQTILGNFVFQVDYADYKDFGGVKLPAMVRYAMPNLNWTRKVLEVKNNLAIDEAKFAK